MLKVTREPAMTIWYFVFLIAPAANAQLHVSAMAAITGGTCSLQSVQDESHMDMNVTTAHMKDRLGLTMNDYYSENNGYGLDSHMVADDLDLGPVQYDSYPNGDLHPIRSRVRPLLTCLAAAFAFAAPVFENISNSLYSELPCLFELPDTTPVPQTTSDNHDSGGEMSIPRP